MPVPIASASVLSALCKQIKFHEASPATICRTFAAAACQVSLQLAL